MRTIRNLNLAAAALVLLLLVVVWSLAAPGGATSGDPSPETGGCETQLGLPAGPGTPRTEPALGTLLSQSRDTCPTRPAHTEEVAGR
jgi:hypothetical protein